MGRFAAFLMLIAFAFSVSAWCKSTGDQAGLVAGCCTDQWGTKCDSCSTDMNGKPVVMKYYCANGAPSECFAFKVACEQGKTCSNGACTSVASATYVPTATAAPTYSAPTYVPTAQPTQYPMSPGQPTAAPTPAQPISTDTLMLGGVLVIALLAVIWFVARQPKKERAKRGKKG